MIGVMQDGPLKGLTRTIDGGLPPKWMFIETVLYDPIDKTRARMFKGECTYELLSICPDTGNGLYRFYSQKVPLGQNGPIVTMEDLADIAEGTSQGVNFIRTPAEP